MEIPERDLPLFPLHTVLFPRMPLPLHIFEPRYKEMIARCLGESIGFGVLLIKAGEEVGGPAEPVCVGTVARVVHIEPLSEGRLNLIAMGVVRFRLMRIHHVHPYLSGDIERWEDEMGDLRELPRLTRAAHRAYIHYIAELSELLNPDARPQQIIAPLDPQILSYTIAANLQAPNEEKQALLESPTVEERLARELRLLEIERAFLQRVKRMRETLMQRGMETFSKN